MTRTVIASIAALLLYLPNTPFAMSQLVVQMGKKTAVVAQHPKQKLASMVKAGNLSNRYFSVQGFASSAATTDFFLPPVGAAGVFRKLCVSWTSDPGSGGTTGWKITLLKNGSATGATQSVEITSADSGTTPAYSKCTAGGDFSVASTDTVQYQVTAASGGAGLTTVQASTFIEFEATADDGTTILLADPGAALSATDTHYIAITGSNASNATEFNRTLVIPMAGTITGFSFNLVTAVTGAQTRTYTIRKTTGTGSGTTTSCTGNACGGTDSSISYTSGGTASGVIAQAESIPVSQGDRIDILQNTANTPGTSNAGWSILFKPTTTGQFIIPNFTTGNLSVSASTFIQIQGGGSNSNSLTEATVNQIMMADSGVVTLEGFTACLAASPGASPRSYTLSLQLGGSPAGTSYSTALTAASYCPVTSANTSYAIPADFGLYDTLSTPSATAPGAQPVTISYIGYIAP